MPTTPRPRLSACRLLWPTFSPAHCDAAASCGKLSTRPQLRSATPRPALLRQPRQPGRQRRRLWLLARQQLVGLLPKWLELAGLPLLPLRRRSNDARRGIARGRGSLRRFGTPGGSMLRGLMRRRLRRHTGPRSGSQGAQPTTRLIQRPASVHCPELESLRPRQSAWHSSCRRRWQLRPSCGASAAAFERRLLRPGWPSATERRCSRPPSGLLARGLVTAAQSPLTPTWRGWARRGAKPPRERPRVARWNSL